MLEDDGVTPALQEDQRARILVQDGKVLLLAAISTNAMLREERALDYRYGLPPLQSRARRRFAFG